MKDKSASAKKRRISDRAQAGLAASHILDTAMPKHEAETMADMIKDVVADGSLRHNILHFYKFQKFLAAKEKAR